jgi:integrase
MGKNDKTRLGTVPIKFRPERRKFELTLYSGGKRSRSLHDTQAEAEKAWASHLRQVKRFGIDGAQLSPDDARELVEARRIIPSVDLRDAARFYLLHHPEGAKRSTVTDAVAEFLAHQAGKRLAPRYLAGLSQRTGAFADVFGDVQVRSITGNVILDWLQGMPHDPRTVKNYSTSIATFFNWCQRRGIISVSPCASIQDSDLPKSAPKPKGVLSVDQCAAMMAWIDVHAPKYAPWHALQLFAGIRRAEVGRMQWEWIDLETRVITLPGWTEGGDRVVKTGDDWALHDLPANLWEWLAKHKDTGKVSVPGSKTVEAWRGTEFFKIGIPKWPQNAMRHTFCTMMMSLHGDAAKVAMWSRHTNASQLYKGYVAKLVSREEAGRFVGILPRK